MPCSKAYLMHRASCGFTTRVYAVRAWAAVRKIFASDDARVPVECWNVGDSASPVFVRSERSGWKPGQLRVLSSFASGGSAFQPVPPRSARVIRIERAYAWSLG